MRRTREVSIKSHNFRTGETFTIYAKGVDAAKAKCVVHNNGAIMFVCGNNVNVPIADVQVLWVHEQVF